MNCSIRSNKPSYTIWSISRLFADNSNHIYENVRSFSATKIKRKYLNILLILNLSKIYLNLLLIDVEESTSQIEYISSSRIGFAVSTDHVVYFLRELLINTVFEIQEKVHEN